MNDSTAIVRDSFGGQEIERRGETAASALVAREHAEVQARFIMAARNPRDPDEVRSRLIRECQRTTFAEGAFYAVPRKGNPPPIGRITGREGFVEGLSVRFAEAAIRISTNIKQIARTTYEDEKQRNVYVAVLDLETNSSYEKDITIPKTVERNKAFEWQTVIAKRTNSAGRDVYVIAATEEELATREASAVSKAFRTLGLRLVPSDILEDCQRTIVETISAEDKKAPDATRKKLIDSFGRLNISPADLAAYLGHEIGRCSPAELGSLRALGVAIRDGLTTWAEVIADRTKASDVPTADAPKKSKAERLADRVAKAAAPVEHDPVTGEGVPPEAGRQPGED